MASWESPARIRPPTAWPPLVADSPYVSGPSAEDGACGACCVVEIWTKYFNPTWSCGPTTAFAGPTWSCGPATRLHGHPLSVIARMSPDRCILECISERCILEWISEKFICISIRQIRDLYQHDSCQNLEKTDSSGIFELFTSSRFR